MTHKIRKEILISLSLANLLFVASWRELLYPATYNYHIKFGPKTNDYLSVMLCVVIGGAAIFGVYRIVQHFFGEKAALLGKLVFLAAFLIAVNICRLNFQTSSNGLIIGAISQIIMLAVLVMTLTKWRDTVFNFAKASVLMLSPFILITFSQSVWGIVRSSANVENEVPIAAQLAKLPPNPDKKIKSRVIWIIFDEFDYRVPFELKPVELPEFDRLKNQSLTATNAQPPAWATVNSIASLLTGKKVIESEPSGSSRLVLNFSDGTTGDFSRSRNLFYDVKELNGNISVLGWHHPYCSLFTETLSVCKWEGEKFSKNLSLPETMLTNLGDMLEQLPLIFNLFATQTTDKFSRDRHFVFTDSVFDPAQIKAAHFQRLSEIKQLAADPNLDFAFFHLPVPHAPVQYNRFTKEFTAERQDYVNNLALCDIILGELRKSMEDAGEWDNSTVIISSDHQWRINTWKEQNASAKLAMTDNDRQLTQGVEDPRIPFFIKLKNQKESVVYDKPFNTLITSELILAVMKGEISTPEELKNRLDAAK